MDGKNEEGRGKERKDGEGASDADTKPEEGDDDLIRRGKSVRGAWPWRIRREGAAAERGGAE
jgi:hypothetical protein